MTDIEEKVIRCDQVTIGNLLIMTTTTMDKPIHYTVYLKRDGNDYLLTSWFDILSGRCKRVNEIIAEAYQRVFMWIRPQMSSGLFIDNLSDRDLFLHTLNDLYLRIFGVDTSMRPEQYIYHDVRNMASMEGTVKLFRTYDPQYDLFTSTMVMMPKSIGSAGVTKSEVSVSDRQLDPGDWVDGEWTPATRDPLNHIPITDEHESTNERPTIVY